MQKESLLYASSAAYKLGLTHVADLLRSLSCSLSFSCFKCQRWSIPLGQLSTVFGVPVKGRPGVMCHRYVLDRQGTFGAAVDMNSQKLIVRALCKCSKQAADVLGNAESITLRMMSDCTSGENSTVFCRIHIAKSY